MEELSKNFYRLDELAARWCKSESDLLQMAAAGELCLSCFFKGKHKGVICAAGEHPSRDEIIDIFERLEGNPDRLYIGYVALSVTEAREIAANFADREHYYTTNQIQISEEVLSLAKGDWLLLSEPFGYSSNEIVVLASEVDRLEGQYPALLEPSRQTESPAPHTFGTESPVGASTTKGVIAVPVGTEWHDITFRFEDTQAATITVKGRHYQRSFRSFDFSFNKRKKSPTILWNNLLNLAVHQGNPPARTKITSKHVSDLRKHIKAIFPGVDGEPIGIRNKSTVAIIPDVDGKPSRKPILVEGYPLILALVVSESLIPNFR